MKMTSDFSLTSRWQRDKDWRQRWAINGILPILVADYDRGIYGADSRQNFNELHNFMRTTDAWMFNAGGALTNIAANEARFAHDLFGNRLGLTIEAEATNELTNSALTGAVVGGLAASGTLPDGWTISGFPLDSISVEALAPLQGLPRVRVRLQGTPAQSTMYLFFSDTTSISALAAEDWNLSLYTALAEGSFDGISEMRIFGSGWTETGGYVSGSPNLFTGPNIVSAVETSLSRFDYSGQLQGADVAHLRPALRFDTTGTPLDVTLDLCLPQVERGIQPTSPIITSGKAVTRSSETISLKNLSGTFDMRLTEHTGVAHDFRSQVVTPGFWPNGFEVGLFRSIVAYPQGTL